MQPKPLIPHGVGDLFFGFADKKRQLQRRFMNLFRSWGYSDVIPPEFEYAEFLERAGGHISAEMYRFFDPEGQLLALRPDITTQIARIVGTRLYDQPMPLRFCYVGEVFRYSRLGSGRQREFTQTGVELIGSSTPEADAEILAIAVSALQEANLEDFRITLGQMAFFRGLLADLSLSPEQEREVKSAVDRKNFYDLEAIAEKLDISVAQREALIAIPGLHGSDGVLDRAEAVVLNEPMEDAVRNLREIEKVLDAYGLKDRISLDLGEVRGMEYYTGITFEAFTRGVGEPVAAGGRYDDLIGRFGRDFPAVGVALNMDAILLAQERQGKVPAVRLPHVVVSAPAELEPFRLVQEARHRGAQVEVDVIGRGEGDLLRYAREKRIPRVAIWRDGAFRILEGGAERRVRPEEWLQEVESWLR